MNNFILHTPTKVLFGKGQVAQLRGQIPSDARILVTYGGGSVVRSGLLDQIRSELAGRVSTLPRGMAEATSPPTVSRMCQGSLAGS